MTNKNFFAALSKIDQYADVVSLTLNGKKFHGTRLGGCLTIMLYLTVFAYWVSGTLNCFNYSQPQVFTANVPTPTGGSTNLNITMGVLLKSQEATENETLRYLSIVFNNAVAQKWYNAT